MTTENAERIGSARKAPDAGGFLSPVAKSNWELLVPGGPNLWSTSLGILVLWGLVFGSSKDASAVVQSTNLNFATNDQSMWGAGSGFNLDKTWDDFIFPVSSGGTKNFNAGLLGANIDVDYSYSGRVGLEPRLRISSGEVDVSYPVRVNASLPEKVTPGSTFSIDTSSWSHLASQISSTGPGARFTLDAIMEFDASIGPLCLSCFGYELVDAAQVNLGIEPFRKSIIDVGSGAPQPNIEFPTGPYGTISLSVPDILELSSSTLIPPELAKLQAVGQGDDRFLNLNVDLDALVVSLFALPPTSLGDEYEIVEDRNNDGRSDFSIAYELLNVGANLGLKFAQQMTFIPTSIGIEMTSESGQIRTGVLGDTFTFDAPAMNGEFGVDAEFTLNGQLRSQTGFVINGSLEVQAGKFVFHNEVGPDFDVNLASDLLGLDSDFLFDMEFPEGGIDVGPPLYLFDSTFALGGFEKQLAMYRIQVVPEPSSFLLLTLTCGILARLRQRTLKASSFQSPRAK